MIIIVKMLNIRHIGPLSNALNKAGLSQEIAFKGSDCLECSMRHTNHSSIFYYDHHGHSTELVLLDACCQSGLLGFEGAELAMHQ